MTSRRPPSVARYDTTTNRPTSRDAPHARREVECGRCKESRVFFAFVAPDPHGRADVRVERDALSWMQSHPCLSSVYAHPKPPELAPDRRRLAPEGHHDRRVQHRAMPMAIPHEVICNQVLVDRAVFTHTIDPDADRLRIEVHT